MSRRGGRPRWIRSSRCGASDAQWCLHKSIGHSSPPRRRKKNAQRLMADTTRTKRFRFWFWLIRFFGVIVPRRFRARFLQEWEAELEYREELLARWDRLDWHTKFELL